MLGRFSRGDHRAIRPAGTGFPACEPFINSTLVAFLGAVLGGLGARWVGSQTVATAMIASILLVLACPRAQCAE